MSPTSARRRWWATVAGSALLASGLVAPSAQADPQQQPELSSPEEKIQPEVEQELEADGSTDFWVRFADRPDLTQFESIQDWDERGQAIYDALTATAEASQASMRAELDADGVDYQAFWATNALRVEGGDSALALDLAADPAVEGIYPTREYEMPEPEIGMEPAEVAPAAVEWGVADIRADEVWSAYDVDGEGIVVGSIDTGAQFDHPALVNQYRGNNGDGTFTHDYNWFNAAGTTADFPSDGDGHGTHVTGTMVGSDGGSNQIGVAPGAKWISANGCCPTDAAVAASAQWMLAPTDLQGQNADVTKRPHVINNSWSTNVPSNDPFIEDISEAWNSGGQFAVFANGNHGGNCETSASPGSRIINYSVGNYNQIHQPAWTSSRGAGQDGAIKPDIAAPGSAVRSAYPGNGYEQMTGTSMAAPHVAGAVALLWSASPSLLGDVMGTRALLDGTAIDTEDLQCGGTAGNNNVFGEGRLDTMEMMAQAPLADLVHVEGQVTDAATGEPVRHATVHAEGDSLERIVDADAEGRFRLRLIEGEFTLTTSAFGYETHAETLTLEGEDVVTHDVALTPLPTSTISGTVTDGSGHGWPLYAQISVDGTPISTFTDPVTGDYSLELPAGGTYTLQVESEYPGYQPPTREVDTTTDRVEDFAVVIDASCTAAGYEMSSSTGVSSSFEDGQLPEGWEVVDNIGNGQVWRFDNPGERANNTGGSGGMAISESDFYGGGYTQDTELITASADMSDLSDPELHFRHDFRRSGDTARVDVSIDGGQTWTNLVTWTSLRRRVSEVIPLPMAAGQSDVKVRFHHLDAANSWYWQVDDVHLGDKSCQPSIEGGYLVGNVERASDGSAVDGATVTNTTTGESTTTEPTPEDPGLDDGFYWMFSDHPGENTVEASAQYYQTAVETPTVVADDTVRQDFALGSGVVTAEPGSISTELVLGDSETTALTVRNTGQAPAEVSLFERRGDITLLNPDGTTSSLEEAVAAAPERVALDVETSDAAYLPVPEDEDQASHRPAVVEGPWQLLPSLPHPILDGRAVSLEGEWFLIGGSHGSSALSSTYRYDRLALEWVREADLPIASSAMTVGVVGDKIVAHGGWVDSSPARDTFVLDGKGEEWRRVASSPAASAASGSAVIGDTLYTIAGCTTACSPVTNAVHAYDVVEDTWERVANYPIAAAFLSCTGIDGQIYCTGGNLGTGAGTAASYTYDPAADSWTAIADAPRDSWAAQHDGANGMLVVNGGVQDGDVVNTTMGYDVSAGEWVELPNALYPTYRGAGACGFGRFGGSPGGFDVAGDAEYLPGLDSCGSVGADVPWLTLSDYEASIPAGGSVTIDVTTDAEVPQPGTYTAEIAVGSDAPQEALEVPVTMTVTPPASWGRLRGQVEGQSCEGDTAPLDGASVDILVRSGGGWSTLTDEDGRYVRWFDARAGEVEVVASKEGYRSSTAQVALPRGGTVEQDFLLLDAECGEEPDPFGPEVIRVAGEDRYGTSVQVSQGYEPGVGTVFVASGLDFPDALSASALAGSLDAPVLLTKPDSLPSAVATELGRLDPDAVVVLGGERVVQRKVLDSIRRASGTQDVTRLSGQNRYETSALVSARFASADHVYVATGAQYADALAAAARAGSQDVPVLLVRKDRVPGAIAAELDRLDPERIVLMGGTGAVSGEVKDVLEAWAPVERVSGDNRYLTAALLADDLATAETVYVASGQNWPDALASAARAGSQDAPMLLTQVETVPVPTWVTLDRLDPSTIYVPGGTNAVADVVLDHLRTLR